MNPYYLACIVFAVEVSTYPRGPSATEGAVKLCFRHEEILPEASKAKDMSARHESYRIFNRVSA
jgi:hypothetical protein